MTLIKGENLHKIFVLAVRIRQDLEYKAGYGTRNMSQSFLEATDQVIALSGVDISIDEGEYIAIMGPSGSGKSTLLNLLAAIDTPTKGRVYINGENIRALKENKLSDIRYEYIGLVFQDLHLLEDVSVKYNIASPLIMRDGIKQLFNEVDRIAEQLGISELLDKYPSQCSGGQRQKIALARALVTNPKIIVADEPTGNLDSNSANDLMGIFEELNNFGKTILMVTHDCWVASHAKKVLYLKDGKIVETLVKHPEQSKEDFFLQVLELNTKNN